jgi:hypothetical protein
LTTELKGPRITARKNTVIRMAAKALRFFKSFESRVGRGVSEMAKIRAQTSKVISRPRISQAVIAMRRMTDNLSKVFTVHFQPTLG